MLQRNYYFLVASLHDLILDESKLLYNKNEFKDELHSHLHKDDFQLIELLYLPNDNKNLLNILLKNNRPFIDGGKYPLEYLEEQIKEPDTVIDYLKNFIINFRNETLDYQNLNIEDKLTSSYYDFVIKSENKFIAEWFKFDLILKNFIIGLNCRKFNIPVNNYLISSNEITEKISKSTARDFSLSSELPFADFVIHHFETDDSLEFEKNISTLIWQKLDEMTFFNYFSVEKIFAYVVKIDLVERWLKLEPVNGKELFIRFIQDLEKSKEL
ncbi:MAG: DUF2764 family protein [Ignavibacteriales bacterium]|nr:DUF2764 family protein [Ignavibacteriales bacterium]